MSSESEVQRLSVCKDDRSEPYIRIVLYVWITILCNVRFGIAV